MKVVELIEILRTVPNYDVYYEIDKWSDGEVKNVMVNMDNEIVLLTQDEPWKGEADEQIL